jgi:hypothetical protein
LLEKPGKWQQLARLNAWQWLVLFTSPLIFFLTWARLRSVGYKGTLQKTQAARKSRLSAGEQLVIATDTSYALAVSTKYGLWNPKCLVRSLALAWFIGRRGISFDVRIGVTNEIKVDTSDRELDFSAHAWVEHAGVVLNDRKDVKSTFSAFNVVSKSSQGRPPEN